MGKFIVMSYKGGHLFKKMFLLIFPSYGESGTSTSDHESKNVEHCQASTCEEECDLERELEKLRSFGVKDNCTAESDLEEDIKEVVDEEEEEVQEDACESDHYEDENFSSEETDDDCNKCTQPEETKSCSECDMVEKLVAELVIQEMNDADDKKKEPTPAPKPVSKPRKPMRRYRGSRRFGNEDSTFEVIETEHGRFRGCCRHKAENVEGVPSYQGALSLYGLSEDQYQRRDERLQKLEEKQQVKFEQLKEQHQEKSQQNEDAFESWLKHKMKTPQNRTKNMYDVKRKPQKRGSIKMAPKKFRTSDGCKSAS